MAISGLQVIEPVRSRCLCVRVAAPSNEQICQMISHIAAEEDLEVPPELMQRLAKVGVGPGAECPALNLGVEDLGPLAPCSLPQVSLCELSRELH